MLCKVVVLALVGLCAAANVERRASADVATDRSSVGVLMLCTQYGWPTGTYPHPSDCSKYIQCNQGVTAEIDCPLSTVYNPNTRVCDAPANVPMCNYVAPTDKPAYPQQQWTAAPTAGPTAAPTYAPYPGWTAAPTAAPVYPQQQWTAAPTAAPTATPTNPNILVSDLCKQLGYGNGVYFHPYDCAQYLNCIAGHTYVNVCPTGSVYDVNTKQCMSVNGPVGGIPDGIAGALAAHPFCSQYVFNPPTVSPNAVDYDNLCAIHNWANGIHADPYNCLMYIECTFGRTSHMPCPSGLSFDAQALVCDDKRYNNCGGSLLVGK